MAALRFLDGQVRYLYRCSLAAILYLNPYQVHLLMLEPHLEGHLLLLLAVAHYQRFHLYHLRYLLLQVLLYRRDLRGMPIQHGLPNWPRGLFYDPLNPVVPYAQN
jgi:hypothetical protein